ncbi:MAG: ABC transporter permease [Bacillota bacterium]|nr:ABC transporter permease [Bacillota bacterium]
MAGLPFHLLTGGMEWPKETPSLPPGTLWGVVPGTLGAEPRFSLFLPRREGEGEGSVWNWEEGQRYSFWPAAVYQLFWDQEQLVFTPDGEVVTQGQPPQAVMARALLPTRDIWIPADLFWKVWHEVAGDRPVPVYQWSWRVEDTLKGRVQAEAIARQLGGTAVSLYDLRRSATLRPDILLTPSGLVTRIKAVGPPHLEPPSENLALYSLLLGGLILGGQMIHLVARRQKEGAILVALGSTWWEIAWLVLLEGGLYALVGGILGYLLMSLAILPSLLGGQADWWASLRHYLGQGVVVVGVSWLLGWMAAFFALGVLGRRSPVEVLKQ